jgi:hypothetical protein
MKLRLTKNQQMWSDVYNCAICRSDEYFIQGDLDRHKREHTTVILALQKGDKFWLNML